MTCTRETMPILSELETKVIFKEGDEFKMSEHKWCKECSNSYHTICDIIASKFNIPIKNHHIPLKEIRKQSQKARMFLTCANFFSKQNVSYDENVITLILGFERYKKGLMSIADCIRQRMFHHEYCVFNNIDRPNMFGNDSHMDFLVGLSFEFLLLYQPFKDFLPQFKMNIDNSMKYKFIDFKVKNFIVDDILTKYRDIFSAIDTLITYKFKDRRDLIKYIKKRNEDIGVKALKESRNEVCKDIKECIIGSEKVMDCILDLDIYITTSEEDSIYEYFVEYFKSIYKFSKEHLLERSKEHLIKKKKSPILNPTRSAEERAKSKRHLKWLKQHE
jgi:hypothetical protein